MILYWTVLTPLFIVVFMLFGTLSCNNVLMYYIKCFETCLHCIGVTLERSPRVHLNTCLSISVNAPRLSVPPRSMLTDLSGLHHKTHYLSLSLYLSLSKMRQMSIVMLKKWIEKTLSSSVTHLQHDSSHHGHDG